MLTHLTTTNTISDADPGLASYLEAMTQYCVSLRAALPAGDLSISLYHASPGDALDIVHRDLFTVAVGAGEALREVARTRGSRLSAHVLAVQGTPFPHPEILGIPHWLAKLLYARYGIMVGKYGGDGTMSETYLPDPPVPFLALRRAVPEYDRDFLAGTPELAAQLDNPCDEGESPFTHVPGCDRFTAAQASDAFPVVREWGLAQVPDHPLRVEQPRPPRARRKTRPHIIETETTLPA